MTKFNVEDRLAELTSQAEAMVAGEMLDSWKREMLKWWKFRKDAIEDWQNLTEEELVKIKNRVETIADKDDPWNETQVKDLGLIAILYWNAIQ